MTSPTRQALLEAASALFYQQGIRATSVDDILEKAGVARQSLYSHFLSKDGLAQEFLKVRDQRWREAMHRRIATVDGPRGQVLAIFDFLDDWFSQPDFHGCAFINTAVEYAPLHHPFHQLAAQHKALVLDDIFRLCVAAGLNDPRTLASQISLVIEGAIVTELVTPGGQAAGQAKTIANRLIQHAEGDY